MVRTKDTDILKKLKNMKQKAKELNRFSVVAKLDFRIEEFKIKNKHKKHIKW